MTAPETEIRGQLRQRLKNRLDGAIIQCGSGRRFASAYHEKVAVRDHASFWLSSGNWVCVRPSHLEANRSGGKDRVHVT